MKKLLCLTANPLEGGSDRFRIYQFIPYLERAGYATKVRPFATRWLYQALQSRGRVVGKVLQTAFCAARRILDLVSIRDYDLVMVNREVFPFFTPWVERLVFWQQPSVVFNIDDAIFIGHKDTSEMPHPLLHKLKYGRGVNEVIRRSLHVIAGSENLAQHACRFNPKVTVIPTVVDLEQYTYAAPNPERMSP